MSGLRVLVCGGRDFDDRALVGRTLNRVFASVKPSGILIIVGGARGADDLAADYARVRQVSLLTFRAKWRERRKAAGPIRNQQMLDEGRPDLVIAFPGGRGTADMVRRARAAGIEVLDIAATPSPPHREGR